MSEISKLHGAAPPNLYELGAIPRSWRLHRPLNKLLLKIMTEGWTSKKETDAINFLTNPQRPGLYETPGVSRPGELKKRYLDLEFV